MLLPAVYIIINLNYTKKINKKILNAREEFLAAIIMKRRLEDNDGFIQTEKEDSENEENIEDED